MQINEDWMIEAVPMNILLFKRIRVAEKRGKPAHDRWEIKGHYSSVKNTLKGLVDFEVEATGLKDIKTVVKKIDELYALIDSKYPNRELPKEV